MASSNQSIKRYQNFFGIDLKSNDLEFPEQYATDLDNIQFSPNGSMEKRLGYQAIGESDYAKYGLFTYNKVNDLGQQVPEILGVSDKLNRLSETSINVSYSGPNNTAEVKIAFDPTTSVYRCIVWDGPNEVLNTSLGLGIDEALPVTINDLAFLISSIGGGGVFSCSIPPSGGFTPAAFLYTTPLTNIKGNPITIKARYWEELPYSWQDSSLPLPLGLSKPFAGSETNKNEVNFENVTSTQLQNNIYFSNGYDAVVKYDGVNVYKAGLPPDAKGEIKNDLSFTNGEWKVLITTPVAVGGHGYATFDSTTDRVTVYGNSYTDGQLITITDQASLLLPAGSLPSTLTSGSSYYVRNIVSDTFQLSATPTGAIISLTGGGTGVVVPYNTDFTKYVWKAQYVFVDANGNVIESNVFQSSPLTGLSLISPLTPARLAIPTLKQTYGFGSNIAFVNGSQVYNNVDRYKTIQVTKKYTFSIPSSNITAGDVYGNNGQTFVAIQTNSATTSFVTSGTGTPQVSGTLIKLSGNVSSPATIAFSSYTESRLHTVKIGEYLVIHSIYDARSYNFKVTNVTDSNITIDTLSPSSITNQGTRLSFSPGFVLSNTTIRLYRNKNTNSDPTLWFEVFPKNTNNSSNGLELSNNCFLDYIEVDDNVHDPDLVAQFSESFIDRSPPVKGKYISGYQNLMITAGSLQNPNEVSFSDVTNCEYFPVPASQFRVGTIEGDQVTGIHPSSESFIIFQNRSIHAVTGDVPNLNFRVDVITQDIGCAAHASIQDLRGAIAFMSNVGPRVMIGASIPKGLGVSKGNELNSRIDPLFIQRGEASDKIYRLKRAIAINDRQNERYFIYIPAETVDTGQRFPNENSLVLCYDYTRDSWLKWSNINARSGMALYEPTNEIFFSEKRDSDSGVGINSKTYVYKFHNTGTSLDYEDNNQPIQVTYKSPWEFMGDTNVLKSFQRIRAFPDVNVNSDFTLSVTTEKDFIPDFTISNCSLQFYAIGYGNHAWGTSNYGDNSFFKAQHKLSNGKSISLRVIFENAQHQTNIGIAGYELEIVTPYKPGMKK